MLAVLKGSELTGHHQDDAPRVQDAYSVRCAPQVAGAGRDTMAHARLVAERELASAVDNPVVLPDGRVESNGNFHGAPVAYVLDFLAIAAADLGSIAERRTDRLLDKNRSHGLPPFLADDAGVDSGLMIAQYTQAALVSEMKRLAVPASADSIPSSAMQEDHVSMGWSAARKLRTAIDNLTRIVAVELYAATRGIELREGLTPAPASRAVIDAVRAAGVQGPGPDRFLAPDLAAADAFVRGGPHPGGGARPSLFRRPTRGSSWPSTSGSPRRSRGTPSRRSRTASCRPFPCRPGAVGPRTARVPLSRSAADLPPPSSRASRWRTGRTTGQPGVSRRQWR
jgi:histidine ammonia-lyase